MARIEAAGIQDLPGALRALGFREVRREPWGVVMGMRLGR